MLSTQLVNKFLYILLQWQLQWLYKSCNANIYIFNANSEYQIFALKSIRFPYARTHILNGKWAYYNFSFRGVEYNLNGINQFQVLGEIKLLNQKSLQILQTLENSHYPKSRLKNQLWSLRLSVKDSTKYRALQPIQKDTLTERKGVFK
ncbi:Hypothetical_protein [Hexamita inflata]|uniref:Hypothetical_protein n=1 Tax=Hexamita inflata TaxID=28002 RepID=A0AA86PA07_9EUKA|nr:Hypothetical protein HINF_LOCUS22536 [Hexamita inflata]